MKILNQYLVIALLTFIGFGCEYEREIIEMPPPIEDSNPAQNNVVNADARAVIVPSNDLSRCFHYCAGSQVLIGERAGKAMREFLR